MPARPTLKLPPKPEAEKGRAPARAPVRGGAAPRKPAKAGTAVPPAMPGGGAKPPATGKSATRKSAAGKPVVPAARGPAAGKRVAPAAAAPRRRESAAVPPRPPRPVGEGQAAPAPRAPSTKQRFYGEAAAATRARAAHHAPPDEARSELPRLSKVMSERGLCSRREADAWIVNGWVRVDGEVCDTLGTRVAPGARIDIDAAAKRHQGEAVTILLNKPVGYVSGQAEDGYKPALLLVRAASRWAEDPAPLAFERGHLRGLAPAGRLDIDSTGLLVFTQDGRIAKALIGEDSKIEKEYLVRVEGRLSDEGLARLNHGLSLDGVALKRAKVSWQNEDQLRFVLREGRKRQIRRMCELVGLKVTGLKRIRIGSVALGKLPAGQWRYLRRDERF